jgi:hypothetical protein
MGFADGSLQSLRAVAKITHLSVNELVVAELDLMRRLGWFVQANKALDKKWRSQ